MTPYLLLTVLPFLARARGDIGAQLARSVTTGFGRAVGSMAAHSLGLPVAGAALALVVLGSVCRRKALARRRPARRR